jgi:tetratricopeptide (TPR) repeat protein
MGIIYEHMNDSENSAKSLTRAIEVFEKINSDEAREQLSSCLNARGCMNYRMGNYQNEVDDITRAISLHSNEESGLSVAIMLKNRSDAYQALGDYRAMQADLTKSIDILDKSDVPDGALDSMYGENWYSLGVCLEELNKAGRAADSYRTAEKYLTASQSSKDDMLNTMMRIMCHFRRANCLYLRDEQEYYGALSEYDNAVKLLEELPPSMEKNQRLIAVLTSRGSLYETFREIDLAKADYAQAEQLRKDSPQSLFSTSGNNENA